MPVIGFTTHAQFMRLVLRMDLDDADKICFTTGTIVDMISVQERIIIEMWTFLALQHWHKSCTSALRFDLKDVDKICITTGTIDVKQI